MTKQLDLNGLIKELVQHKTAITSNYHFLPDDLRTVIADIEAHFSAFLRQSVARMEPKDAVAALMQPAHFKASNIKCEVLEGYASDNEHKARVAAVVNWLVFYQRLNQATGCRCPELNMLRRQLLMQENLVELYMSSLDASDSIEITRVAKRKAPERVQAAADSDTEMADTGSAADSDGSGVPIKKRRTRYEEAAANASSAGESSVGGPAAVASDASVEPPKPKKKVKKRVAKRRTSKGRPRQAAANGAPSDSRTPAKLVENRRRRARSNRLAGLYDTNFMNDIPAPGTPRASRARAGSYTRTNYHHTVAAAPAEAKSKTRGHLQRRGKGVRSVHQLRVPVARTPKDSGAAAAAASAATGASTRVAKKVVIAKPRYHVGSKHAAVRSAANRAVRAAKEFMELADSVSPRVSVSAAILGENTADMDVRVDVYMERNWMKTDKEGRLIPQPFEGESTEERLSGFKELEAMYRACSRPSERSQAARANRKSWSVGKNVARLRYLSLLIAHRSDSTGDVFANETDPSEEALKEQLQWYTRASEYSAKSVFYGADDNLATCMTCIVSLVFVLEDLYKLDSFTPTSDEQAKHLKMLKNIESGFLYLAATEGGEKASNKMMLSSFGQGDKADEALAKLYEQFCEKAEALCDKINTENAKKWIKYFKAKHNPEAGEESRSRASAASVLASFAVVASGGAQHGTPVSAFGSSEGCASALGVPPRQ